MKEQIDQVVKYLKNLDIDGCITGSCLLDYFEGQDVDIFCYTEASFTKLLYTLYFNERFLLLEPLEEWKFKDWTEKDYKASIKKLGLITIKFKYNTCIDVNIIYKSKCCTVFDILKSFDMDIVSKGFDIKTKQYLDLTNNPGKIASWNKWNTSIDNANVWSISRILRQFERVIKYWNRGYDTDNVARKYISLIEDMIDTENIFNSTKYEDKISVLEVNGKIMIEIMNKWLSNHEITKEELDLMKEKIKEL